MRQDSLAFFESLANVPSPPGHEQRAAELFRRYLTPFTDELRTDLHGNTFAILNPSADFRLMLAGHIDEIGFIVNFIGDDGLIYFKGVGGHDPSVAVGQRVWIHGRQRVAAVVGRRAIHLLEDEGADATEKAPKLHDLWIDAGFRSREDAEKQIRLGDPITYATTYEALENDMAVGRSFDNKIGAFVVAEVLRRLKEEGLLNSGVGLYSVATVQEEIGFRGATTAAYAVGATAGIAVDVSHATDLPGINKERHGLIQMGKGPAITRGAYSSPVVSEMLLNLAEQDGIPVQIEVAAECSGTDATPMQVSRGGMAVGIVGVPLRYMHTPCEMVCLSDIDRTVELIVNFCSRVTPDTPFTPL